MDIGLKDRVYIVTGGTSGLGRACVAALLADGALVVIASRDKMRVESTVSEFEESHAGQVLGMVADLVDPSVPARLIQGAVQKWGRIDGLLVSGGGPPVAEATVATDAQWRDSFESIFVGPLRLAREAAAEMKPGGCISMVLSGSVYSPISNLALSNGLRPGLAMALKTLSDEIGETGIRTIGLVPGRIETSRTLEVDSAHPEVSARRNRAIPLGRLGTPEEFARVAAFMLSPAASYVNGTCIVIDGGAKRSL